MRVTHVLGRVMEAREEGAVLVCVLGEIHVCYVVALPTDHAYLPWQHDIFNCNLEISLLH